MTTNVIRQSNTIQTVYTRKSAVLNLSRTEISTAVLFRNPIAFNRKSAALKSPLSAKINKRRGALSKIHYSTNVSRICDFLTIWCKWAALIFVRLILRAAFFGVLYGIDSVCRFYYYTFFGQFLLLLWALLHFWSIIAFLASVGSCL